MLCVRVRVKHVGDLGPLGVQYITRCSSWHAHFVRIVIS
jgi:hypothetical protein